MRWRNVVGLGAVVLVAILIAGACVWNFGLRRQGAPVAGSIDEIEQVVGPLGDARLLGELCDVSACVADLVVLPDLHPLEAAVDIPVAETLGALSIERVWTGGGEGLFGEGWTSLLDVRLDDGLITGPVGGRPVEASVDGVVDLSDGSRITFDDGRPESLCGIGMLCTDVTWSDDVVRLAAATAPSRWVELELTDGVVSNAMAWDGRTVAYGHEDGRLVRAGDTEYRYDDDRLAEVDDGFVPRSFTYVDGALVSATDRDQGTWTFEATDAEVLVAAPQSTGRSYVFDDARRLTTIVDDQGDVVLSRAYAGVALVREERPLDGVVMEMVEPGVVEIEQTSDLAPPRRTTHRYDDLGRLSESVEAGVPTTYRYDGSGRLEAVSHAGGETSYEYDAAGLLASTTDPDGYRVEVTRLADGSISAIADDATRTELDYDDLGRPVAQRDGPLESRAGYGARGEVSFTSDPGGARTEYAYDDAGRLVDDGPSSAAPSETSIDSDGASAVIEARRDITMDSGSVYRYSNGTAIRYDEHGRPVETTTQTGSTERRDYDSFGRVETLVGFDGVAHRLTYTPGGRVASLDRDGDRYDFTWNGERLTAVAGPLGLDMSYEWNSAGSVASALANGMEWTYAYDDEGNLERVETPHGSVEATWEGGLPRTLSGPDGPAQTIEWIDGQVASLLADDDGFVFDYDSDGRMIEVSDQDGDDLESYWYDERGRLSSATSDGDRIEVRHGDAGIESITFGDVTETWSRSDVVVEAITVDEESYELDWLTPGLLTGVSIDGESLIDVATDSMGRITSISSGDEVRAEFSWDSSGLVAATIGDDRSAITRNALGLTERFTGGDLDYRAEYDGAALRSATIDDVTLGYEFADGDLVESTLAEGSDTVSVAWDDGSRVESFESSEGDGAFEYDDDAASEIRYDERVRPVEFDDDGNASADGTGQEFLDDLFLEDGRPSLGATLPAQAPSIPALADLPGDLGFSLPQPVTGSDMVDAGLLIATPVVPSPIVAGGTDALVDRAISTALGMAGRVDIAVDPLRSVQVAPLGTAIEPSELLSAAPTFVVAASVLDRLGPDASMAGRIFNGVEWTVSTVGNGLASVARFIANNPVVRATASVLFVAGSFASVFCPPGPAVGCGVGLHFIENLPRNLADATSPLDFLERAALAPIRSFATDLSNLDVRAWMTLASTVSQVRSLAKIREPLAGVQCGLKRLKCLREFAGAAWSVRDVIGTARPHVLAIDSSGALDRLRDPLGGSRRSDAPVAGRPNGAPTSLRFIGPNDDRSAAAALQRQTSGLPFDSAFLVLVI